MGQLLDKCKKCVDGTIIDWEKTKLSTQEKMEVEEYIVGGIVRLALYVLDFSEYNEFKQYIYKKYGYDVGGTGQISIEEFMKSGGC